MVGTVEKRFFSRRVSTALFKARLSYNTKPSDSVIDETEETELCLAVKDSFPTK